MRRRAILTGIAVLALGAALPVLAARPERAPKPRQVVVNGVVKGAPSGGGFVVHRKGGHGAGRAGQDVAVTTDANTKFVKGDGSAASLADVVDGAKVQAKGDQPAAGAPLLAKQVLVVKGPSAPAP